jgi:hypothetical protein
MDHDEIYDRFCSGKFDQLGKGQREILDVLRGKNGGAGLCDRVRYLERAYKALAAAAVFILGVLAVEGAAWLREIIGGVK